MINAYTAQWGPEKNKKNQQDNKDTGRVKTRTGADSDKVWRLLNPNSQKMINNLKIKEDKF